MNGRTRQLLGCGGLIVLAGVAVLWTWSSSHVTYALPGPPGPAGVRQSYSVTKWFGDGLTAFALAGAALLLAIGMAVSAALRRLPRRWWLPVCALLLAAVVIGVIAEINHHGLTF